MLAARGQGSALRSRRTALGRAVLRMHRITSTELTRMFCRSQSIVASSDFGQVAAPVKCKRWGCPNCAEWRSRVLMARCIAGKPNRFITFTCRHQPGEDKVSIARRMVAAWRTIILRWRRLKPWHKCEYIAVFEPHADGYPHMHILWKGHYLDQKWLSQQGTELLNSPVQSVSRIKDARSAAYYVTKYFSKEPTKFGTLKRYWTSKKWPKLQHIDADRAFHKGFPIDIVNRTIENVLSEWRRYNRNVWERPPDVVGWGCLWEPKRTKPERTRHLNPWRQLSGGRPAGGRRALWARRRGAGA